ncbi:ABC-F family ATP-binding cassette domain-containing protein [Sporosarcina gallistercoris]|uniref:ABC-F family ATP-binding cassette domain-containing protein n=1 Tax=Sporosarcina gallistercoris TaxID=2762245 RepID=A0ABR8PJL3_9BACL|nr:ABC-F family ATP-binding cassette domain-containing protein [Sporosarcina gallistercoris]MBD7908339.1 ABC-F family ATP-binding cassette domain-containing protein [Sporosarcina gallistercoris]
MSQMIIENLTKTVGEKTLFHSIEFTITSGEKTGLLGINGTGKSTLLSIVAGTEDADTISKDHPNNYRIAYLPQDPNVDPTLTVMEAVFQSDAAIIQLNLNYEHALQALTENPDSEENQARFATYQTQMDEQNAWDINTQARTILSKLGIETYDKKMDELSGGQRKRVMLAKTLIEPADLLLLDEPTNHLDVASITWLQDFIRNLSGSVLFVTHDRYFLDAVSTSIFELADKTLYAHKGNYGDYIEAKALREEMTAATEDKLKNRYRSELKWIRRGAKARSTKQKARIGRFEELEQQVKSGSAKEEMDAGLKTSRLGKKVLEAKDISKSFNGKTIIRQFSALLQSGDRIAIVGPNGAGKTTLVNMFDGILEPDEGIIERGTTVKIAYFKQHLPEMKENKRIIEYIRETSNDIEDGEGNRISASQMLERFLFPASAHGTPIGKLSGGERKRLYLLKLLMEQPNVLLLDEPTNDLDLETLSVLETFIDTFPGVVLTISHDRFFLDRTSTKLWVLDGKGNIDTVFMSYTDYLESARFKETHKPVSEPVATEEKPAEKVKESSGKKKLTYKEKREWETIEKEIEETEQAISTTEMEMSTCGADYDKLNDLTKKLAALNERYEYLIERWTVLEELTEN